MFLIRSSDFEPVNELFKSLQKFYTSNNIVCLPTLRMIEVFEVSYMSIQYFLKCTKRKENVVWNNNFKVFVFRIKIYVKWNIFLKGNNLFKKVYLIVKDERKFNSIFYFLLTTFTFWLNLTGKEWQNFSVLHNGIK